MPERSRKSLDCSRTCNTADATGSSEACKFRGKRRRKAWDEDVVVRAVEESDLDIDHGIPSENTVLHRLLAASIHRGDVLPRDAPTGHLVLEQVTATFFVVGLDGNDDPAELS